MPRPISRRRVTQLPGTHVLVTLREIEEIVLGLDELEALRLADLDGLYQEEAARRMRVSRATFGRVVALARHKVAKALVEGMAIRIQGGNADLALPATADRSEDAAQEGEQPAGA